MSAFPLSAATVSAARMSVCASFGNFSKFLRAAPTHEMRLVSLLLMHNGVTYDTSSSTGAGSAVSRVLSSRQSRPRPIS